MHPRTGLTVAPARASRLRRFLGASLLVAATALALAACGPASTDPRRLWLDVPVDGTRILTDKQPKPF